MRHQLIALTIALAAAISFACLSQTRQAKASPTTAPAELKITIDNFNFQPKSPTVNTGTIVTWINKDDVPHTATAKGENPTFDSGLLDTDDKFSFTFSKPGTYDYYCKVHPHMRGTITVK